MNWWTNRNMKRHEMRTIIKLHWNEMLQPFAAFIVQGRAEDDLFFQSFDKENENTHIIETS